MFTLNKFNNRFINKRVNPREEFKKNNYSTNSSGAPFRMPFNHYRKTTYCPTNDCSGNEKISQDTAAHYLGNNSCMCYDPTIRSYLNKNGIPQHDFIFSGSNVLYKNKKTIEQNNVSKIVSSIPLNGTNNTYNGSLSNPNNPENKLQEPCHVIVHKISNYSNQRNSATSYKSRIARLKFNNTTAKQINNYGQCKNNSNNCFPVMNKSRMAHPFLCRRKRLNKKEVCE